MSGQAHFVMSETLNAAPEALFDVISDPRRRSEWQSSLRSVHLLVEGEPRRGMRWYEITRGGLRFDLEIVVQVRLEGVLKLGAPLLRWLMPFALRADLKRAAALARAGS